MSCRVCVLVVSLGLATTLSGCGTESGADSPPPDTGTPTSYEPFALDGSVPGRRAVVATAYRVSGNGQVDIARATGTFDGDTGALALSDDLFAFLDANGPAGDGEFALGPAYYSLLKPAGDSDFEFVRVADAGYTVGAQTYTLKGHAGIATGIADMPATGTANFAGAGNVAIVTGQEVALLHSDAVVVTADFDAGTVDVVGAGFTGAAVDPFAAAAISPGMDQIAISGMAIAGSRFSGGNLSVTRGGVEVTLTGTNTLSGSAGDFYGFDAQTNLPAEVAGVAYQVGDSGYLVFDYYGK